MKRIILLLISAFVLACSVMTIVGGKETDNFIKYAEFNVTADALQKAVSYDASSQSEDTKLNYIEILSYLGAKYGGFGNVMRGLFPGAAAHAAKIQAKRYG